MSTPPSVAKPGEVLSPAVTAFRLIITLAQELRGMMDARLQESGLTTQQAALLTVIEVKGNPPTMTEAARAMGMSHQNIKQLAVVLERKGFLNMVPDEHDARSKRMETTRKHRKFWARRDPHDHAVVAGWLAGLTSQEQEMLAQLLGKALASARSAREAGTAIDA
jgi:DNA-binding MarR family transcriptional regulator